VKTVQGRLEEETRKRQELEQRMSDVLTYMQSLCAATGVRPPASQFAQPPPPDPYSTPMSGDKLYLCMIVIYLVSHAISSPLCRDNRRHQMIRMLRHLQIRQLQISHLEICVVNFIIVNSCVVNLRM
jgi:hypothetical protein